MSKTLIPAQRRERIQEYLAIHKIVPSADLSGMLEVSEATIRRDLEWMEGEGILTRTHGRQSSTNDCNSKPLTSRAPSGMLKRNV
jgi:DeoR/GlpR family transcriptional regulator of sugar metabolism